MKRYIKYLAVIVSVILMAVTAAGCSVNKSNAGTQAAVSSGKTSEVKTDAAGNDYFTERDLDPSYDECMKRAVLLEDEIWEENLKLIKRETT